MADTETAIQMVWDAAWALHDGQPDWQPSKRLKDAIDALIAAVRAENGLAQYRIAILEGDLKRLKSGYVTPGPTPGCDCDQDGNADAGYHASDCNWRVAVS
jgi:hypothetical protein